MLNSEAPVPYVTSPESAPNYIPEELLSSELYVSSRQLVMRCLATLRLQDRRSAQLAGEQFDASLWRPDAERLYHLSDETLPNPLPVARRIGRFLGMAENLARYRDHLEHSGLRPEDQIEPFEALIDFYHPTELGKQLPLDVTLAHVLGGGYGKMATGWGKMAVMAKFAEAAGIGQHPFDDPSITPYRALILAGDKVNLKQLIGREVFDGFAKFAPEMRLTAYTSKEKDLSGDGVVMPYLMFERATKENRYDLDEYDIVLPDEGHHLQGRNTRAAHDKFRQLGIPTLAVTATPDYQVNRRLRQILPYEICDIDKRDLVELGTLSGVQLFWATTGKTLKVQQRRGEYTDREMYSLAHDDDRNTLILEWVKVLVGDGRPTVVTAARGDKCWHAEHLASMCNNTEQYKILDEKTGELRQIVAKAVHGYMSESDLDTAMEDWEAGRIDVLFLTDKFRESWNTTRIGAMVFGVPTTSELVMDQWIGRALRQNPELPIKVLVHLDDAITGHKPKFTPFHALGEDIIEQGKIVASRATRQKNEQASRRMRRPGRSVKPTRAVDDYPESINQQLQVEGLLLREAELTSRAEAYQSPPEDYIPLKDTQHLWQGQSFDQICRILAKQGYPYIVARGRRGPMRHVHRDAEVFLNSYELPDFAPKGTATGTTAAVRCGVSHPYFVRVAEELQITPADYRTRKTGQIFDHYTDAQIEAVKTYIEQERAAADEPAVHDIGAEFGLGQTSTTYNIRQMPGEPIAMTPKRLASGQMGLTVNVHDAVRIRAYLKEMQITPENGKQPLPAIMAATGASRAVLISWAKQMAIRGHLARDFRKGRLQNAKTGHIEPVKFLEADDATKLARAVAYHLLHGGERYQLAPESWTEGAPVLKPVAAYQPSPASISPVATQSDVFAPVTPNAGTTTVASDPSNSRSQAAPESPTVLMEQLGCTPAAMQYLIGVAGIGKSDLIASDDGGEVLLKAQAVTRISRFASTARRSQLQMGWVSNDMLAQQISASSERVLQRVRQHVGISEGEVVVAVAESSGMIDVWYCESLWRRAQRILKPVYTGRE